MLMLEEEKRFITENYLTISYKDIAKKLNLTKSCVSSFIYRNNLTKGYIKKYSHNKNYFTLLNNENCYWAGFLAADGYTRTKLNQLCLTLSIKDIEHMKLFTKSIEYTGDIKTFFAKKHDLSFKKEVYENCHITICSANQILIDLKNNFNVSDRKSLIYNPPKIDNLENRLSLIKGLIDGDGTIYVNSKNRLQFSICGTKETCDFICEEFNKLVPSTTKHNAKPVHRKDRTLNNHYTLKITGVRAYKILSILNKIETPALNRKWDSLKFCNKNIYTYLVRNKKFQE